MAEMSHLGRQKTLLWKCWSKPNQTYCFGPGAKSLPDCQEQKNTEEETQDTAGQGCIHDDLKSLEGISQAAITFWLETKLGTKSFSHRTLRIVWIQTVTHDNVHLSWLQSLTARIALSIWKTLKHHWRGWIPERRAGSNQGTAHQYKHRNQHP